VKIASIMVGVIEDGAPRVHLLEPNAEGLTIVPCTAFSAEQVATAVRHVLSRPEPRPASEIQFVRIAIAEPELEVADDAVQSLRMLTDRDLVLDARGEDEEMDELLERISTAAGVDPLGPALTIVEDSADATEEELAYVDAQRRAIQLAAAVRGVDDQMTASVVPDWLWIATAFGGLGVLLTAIVFLYPETRIVLIPALIVLSVIGFLLYGWRSFKELRVRGALQLERAELRARREAAKLEAMEKRDILSATGRDADAIFARLEGLAIPRNVPAILSRAAGQIAELAEAERQTIVFVDSALEHERARPWRLG
jgi:hypothetical protein